MFWWIRCRSSGQLMPRTVSREQHYYYSTIIIIINTINIIWNISIRNWFSSYFFLNLFVTIFGSELFWLCGVQYTVYGKCAIFRLKCVVAVLCFVIFLSLSLINSLCCFAVLFIQWLIQVDCAYKFNLTIFRIINSPRQSSISIDLFGFCCFAQ